MGAKQGNKNAQRGKHPRMLIGINGPTVDLIYEWFALSEGNANPTTEEVRDAIYYAIRQVYGRRIEDQKAIII